MSRKPLMAGNWKMHLNHLEAIALVQKIAFLLKDDDYAACDAAVLPPFTDLRSVQTLVEGDKLKLTTIPAAEWQTVEDEARKFWDEIAKTSPRCAKVVETFKRYNALMDKAGPPYRY